MPRRGDGNLRIRLMRSEHAASARMLDGERDGRPSIGCLGIGSTLLVLVIISSALSGAQQRDQRPYLDGRGAGMKLDRERSIDGTARCADPHVKRMRLCLSAMTSMFSR